MIQKNINIDIDDLQIKELKKDKECTDLQERALLWAFVLSGPSITLPFPLVFLLLFLSLSPHTLFFPHLLILLKENADFAKQILDELRLRDENKEAFGTVLYEMAFVDNLVGTR